MTLSHVPVRVRIRILTVAFSYGNVILQKRWRLIVTLIFLISSARNVAFMDSVTPLQNLFITLMVVMLILICVVLTRPVAL